jgi:hypothetical protein
MRHARLIASCGFLAATLLPAACDPGPRPIPTNPAPKGHETFKEIPTESPNAKGGFQKNFPKAPKQSGDAHREQAEKQP